MSMNSKIRSLIDEIFSEMKMSAENLALRDELMANALAHYEDEIAKGRSEEEALSEVADSLGDVHSLLAEMNAGKKEPPKEQNDKEKPRPFWSAMEEPAEAKPEEKPADEKAKPRPFWSAMEETESPQEEPFAGNTEEAKGWNGSIEDTIGKAFGALGEMGKQVMPQMERLVRKADKATGGMMRDLGRAVGKGMRDMTKAAGDTFDRMTRPQNGEEPVTGQEAATPEEMRKKAAGIRAEAELKQAAGDQEGARDMRRAAYELEMAAEAAEQADAMMKAASEAAAETGADEPAGEKEHDEGTPVEDTEDAAEWLGPDGEIDHEAFAKAVDDLAEKAETVARETHDAAFRISRTVEDTVVTYRFPAAGLRTVDITVDADDVQIEKGKSNDTAEVIWEAGNAEGEAPECEMRDHCLSVRRRNPDIFKTFFSVFNKAGGKLTVRIPDGYAAQYKINTTSGDATFEEADADEIQVNTTSGGVRIAPDASFRTELLKVTTVSGPVTISACADTIGAKTVSGSIFISCDAVKTDADSVSGRIHIEGACDTWEVNTVSGEAELLCTVPPAGKITIGTVSANAQVALPDSVRGFVAEASGPNASVVNEFGPNRFGTCSLPIRLETLNGKLIIKRL